jgi:tetratricopeptide (TPR) repeat protein
VRGRSAPGKDRGERREEALRPSRCLGYDRDALGVHLLSCHAYDLAASQLRRAIWLNPYEPRFKEHLACCLYKQGRYREAREWVLKALEQKDEESSRHTLKLIEQKLSARASSSDSEAAGRG